VGLREEMERGRERLGRKTFKEERKWLMRVVNAGFLFF
jgi:hypothetical protein